jgi:hypothetical protein
MPVTCLYYPGNVTFATNSYIAGINNNNPISQQLITIMKNINAVLLLWHNHKLALVQYI